MQIRETNFDERLDLLENIENSDVFLCDKKTNRNAFHNKTVATLMKNTEATHAMLIFERGIPRPRAERTARKIGSTIEGLHRAIQMDVFFDVPRYLFSLIRNECTPIKKRRNHRLNTLKGRTFTQNEALEQLRSSTKPGFGVFCTNADENLDAPPDRVYLLMRLPGIKNLPRLTLKTPEMMKQLIEDLIAHRRYVWPDADPIDPDAELED